MLWRYRYVIIGATLLAGAGAFALALSSTRLYEASAVLSVSTTKLAESNSTGGTANFRPIVLNRAVAQKIVEQFHLDREPYNYTGASFLENATALDEVRATSLMRLSVRMREPALSANVTNALANAAVDFSQSINQGDGARARDMMKDELERASDRLKRASEALAAFTRSSQVELLKADVDAMVKQREQLPLLVARAEGAKAAAAQSDKDLKAGQKIDVTTKSIVDNPAMLAAAKSGSSGDVPLGTTLKSEEVSASYQRLERLAAENRAAAAGAEEEVANQAGVRRSDTATLAKIREYHQKAAELARLELEQKIAERTYTDVVLRYEGARLQVAARSAQLQVIDPAVVPSRPISRQVVSSTLTALIIGFFVSALCALLFGISRQRLATR